MAEVRACTAKIHTHTHTHTQKDAHTNILRGLTDEDRSPLTAVMGTKNRLFLMEKTMSSSTEWWCFSETAGGHIPGKLPETTEKQKTRGENSRPGNHNRAHLAPLHNNSHDVAK